MASYPNGVRIPPVHPDGSRVTGAMHCVGLDREAMQIVENPELLSEVLRRACLINREAVAAALRDSDERFTAIQTGGYVGKYGC